MAYGGDGVCIKKQGYRRIKQGSDINWTKLGSRKLTNKDNNTVALPHLLQFPIAKIWINGEKLCHENIKFIIKQKMKW